MGGSTTTITGPDRALGRGFFVGGYPNMAQEDWVALHPEQPSATSSGRPARNPLDRLWNFLDSPVSAAVLLAVTALMATLAGLVPQMPPSLGDALAQSQWLAETASRWGAFGETLRSLGLFRIENSLLWRGCLGLSLLAVLVLFEASARRAWWAARNELANVPLPIAEERIAQDDAASLLARLAGRFSERGFRTRQTQSGGISQLHAVTHPWAFWLRAALHLGVLLILVALLLGDVSLRTEQLALGPGESSRLSLREGWSVRLRELDENPAGGQYVHASLALFDGEATVLKEAEVRTQRPMSVDGLSLHLTATRPALEVSAADESGQPMPLQSAGGIVEADALLLKFGEAEPEQYFAIPEVGDTVRVALHPDPTAAAQFLVQIYRGTETQPREERLLGAAQSLTVDGVTYTFAPTVFVTLTASSRSLRWLLWTGALLALLSALLLRLFSPRAILVQATEMGGQVYVQVLASDSDAVESALPESGAGGRGP